MTIRRLRESIAIAILLLAGDAAAQYVWPDPSEGVIEGEQAIMVWPIENERLQDPSGCTVHLVPSGRPDEEQVYPCARWFLPPAGGAYDYWLQRGDRISPSQNAMRITRGRGATAGARSGGLLGPGGRVRLSAPVAAGQTFRLLSLTSPGFGFERRIGQKASDAVVLMPAGSLIGGIFDAEGNAIRLTRPFRLDSGRSVVAAPEPPSRGASDLLLVLRGYQRADSSDMRVAYVAGGDPRAPDVLHITATRIFAVWYGLDPGAGRIDVSGDGARFRSDALTLLPGKTTTIRSMVEAKGKG